MSVAVTGASGHLGRLVAEQLLGRLDPSEVVLISRTPDALGDYAARGATVRHGDFDDPAGLEAALAGVQRMLLISTDVIGARVAGHKAAVAAAKAAGVAHVLYTSVPRPEEGNPAAVGPDHRATEDAIRDSGLDWTFLRNNLYAEFQIPGAQQATATGQLFTSAGEGRAAYVSRTDCAAAAAAVLTGDGHAGVAYDITGGEALSADDRGAVIGELTGQTIEVVKVDDDAFVGGLLAAGLPEPVTQTIVSFERAIREGWLEDVTPAVQDLTGQPPRTLLDVLAEAGIGPA